MVTRTIEIEDTLDEIIESVKTDVRTKIENYIKENKEKPDYPGYQREQSRIL
jgi:hypothetical protein